MQYAEVFDWKRRRTLFLTYYTAGDTRNRGMALLEFSDLYRAAGVIPPARELPDHLAVLLEFAATVDEAAGYEQLRRHRTPIDLLHDGLLRASPIYAGVIAAVSATLPPATAADLKEARRLAMQGPPAESVGLEPFALTIGVSGRDPDERRRRVLGHRAVRDHRDPGGRHLVAVPVRQIRLDHPLLPAVREPAAADRQPAVPLRHPGGDLRARHRPASSPRAGPAHSG